MNEPTDRDLESLVAEARRKHGDKERETAKEGPSLARWMWWIHGLASKALRSGEATREALLHLALFALRAAWEASRRTAPPEPERWVIRLDDRWLSSEVLARAAYTPDGARTFPSEEAAKTHRKTLNSEWSGKAVVERVSSPEPAKEPTPSPPSPDVDALLVRAETWLDGWEDGQDKVIAVRFFRDVARALRAERERRREEEREGDQIWVGRRRARAHLRAVLAHGWPEGTTGPACVRAARAFLEGSEPAAPEPDAAWLRARWEESVKEHAATQADCTRLGHEVGRLKSLLVGEQAGHERTREETRKALAAQNQAESEVATLRLELDQKGAALERMTERYLALRLVTVTLASITPAKGEA